MTEALPSLWFYYLSKRQQLIIMLKHKSFTHERIAELLKISRSTVQRELQVIRKIPTRNHSMQQMIDALLQMQFKAIGKLPTVEDRLEFRDRLLGKLMTRRYIRKKRGRIRRCYIVWFLIGYLNSLYPSI